MTRFQKDYEDNRANYRNALIRNGFADFESEDSMAIESLYESCRDMDPNEILEIELELTARYSKKCAARMY